MGRSDRKVCWSWIAAILGHGVLVSGMDWFRTFASEGLYFQAFSIAFGSLVLLRAPYRRKLTSDQIGNVRPALRWLLIYDWERWSAWGIIAISIAVAVLKMTRGS